MDKCKRCGNSNPAYFYKGHKGYYCRKCVSFKRILLKEEPIDTKYEISEGVSEYHFEYPLTSFQEDASLKCLEYLKDGDVLLKAVCGAGKTEIVVRSIACYLDKKLKVCYAIPRREVVIELSKRFEKIFPEAKVVSLYGGHHNEIVGDLIVCTTHQLFRYYKTFDLLILDEVDAYPLAFNNELLNIALNSCKGQIIFSTATVNDFLKSILNKRKYKKVDLYIRPSLKPLIVPKVIISLELILFIYLFVLMKRSTKQHIIFVSNKKLCFLLYRIYHLFFNCTYVYADLADRDKNINDFKNKKYQFIFSTTVLERGITIKDINVIIINLNKNIFDEGSLVQMLGRVGRNYHNPYGEAYILSKYKDKEIDKAIACIRKANEKYALSLL